MVKLTLQGSLPSATDIIPVSTAKNFLRVTHSGDDTLIGNLITAAVEVAQNYTNSRFLETEYNLTMETWTDVYVSNTYAQILTDGVETITGGYDTLGAGLRFKASQGVFTAGDYWFIDAVSGTPETQNPVRTAKAKRY